MLIFDLKQALFIALLAVAALATFLLLLDRYLRHFKFYSPHLVPSLSVLDQAPFGYLVVAGPRIRYANASARQWLGLNRNDDRLPDAAWATLLKEDCAALRTAPGQTPGSNGLSPGEGFPQTGGRLPQTGGRLPQTGGRLPQTGGRLPQTGGRYRYVSLSPQQFVHWWVFPADKVDLVFMLDVTAQQRAGQTTRFLFSDFSHELRTPIATILTHLEVLSVPGLSPAVQQQSLHLLKHEAQRMSRLVSQMLMLGRLETDAALENRPVDLLRLVEETVLQVTPSPGAPLPAVHIEADAPLPPIVGDGGRLKQVFLNLLDNALKYTPSGGQITVSLLRQAEAITCAITDNGPGIAPEHLPHLTRRFYRVAPQESDGSGLGLSIVREILSQHHSELVIESQTEGIPGTQVRFDLPLLPAEEAV